MEFDGWTEYDLNDRSTWPPPRWDLKGDDIPDRALLVLDWIDCGDAGFTEHVSTRWYYEGAWWDLDGNDRSLKDDQPDGATGGRFWCRMPRLLPGRPDDY